ncbi:MULTISPECIES: hypothetical protein [unclassified Streptomyces]|uniref:hypothetical protein n=1 Tax=unclassified Streptomyces TaxID=2593676 RepID=UPI0036E88E96
MTIHAARDWRACGCGEEQIPGLLARVGFPGMAGLILATVVIMILTGWLLATAVWLIGRRRRPRRPAEVTPPEPEPGRPADPPPGFLSGFTWTAEERPRDGEPR